MADKKSSNRFTLYFNNKDPAHRKVAYILNKQEWRGKAQYVVNAVMYYISRGDTPDYESEANRFGAAADTVRHPTVDFDEKYIEAVVNRILLDREKCGSGTKPAITSAVSVPACDDENQSLPITNAEINFDDAVEALGTDGINAIAGALDMFRKK